MTASSKQYYTSEPDTTEGLCSPGVVASEVIPKLVDACNGYRDKLIAALAPNKKYAHKTNIDARACYSRFVENKLPAPHAVAAREAALALQNLLPPALRDYKADLIFTQAASPHQDWDARFLSLVVGTVQAGAPDDGYNMGFTPVKYNTLVNDNYDPQSHAVEKFSVPLQVGRFMSFNPQRAVHWATPVTPRTDSFLILLQWELNEQQDLGCRQEITSHYSSPFQFYGTLADQF